MTSDLMGGKAASEVRLTQLKRWPTLTCHGTGKWRCTQCTAMHQYSVRLQLRRHYVAFETIVMSLQAPAWAADLHCKYCTAHTSAQCTLRMRFDSWKRGTSMAMWGTCALRMVVTEDTMTVMSCTGSTCTAETRLQKYRCVQLQVVGRLLPQEKVPFDLVRNMFFPSYNSIAAARQHACFTAKILGSIGVCLCSAGFGLRKQLFASQSELASKVHCTYGNWARHLSKSPAFWKKRNTAVLVIPLVGAFTSFTVIWLPVV